MGEVKVSATVASYLEDHLALIATETEPEVTPPISDNVILQLVGAPKLVPDAQTLFNHPSNKGKLSPYVGSVIIIINIIIVVIVIIVIIVIINQGTPTYYF